MEEADHLCTRIGEADFHSHCGEIMNLCVCVCACVCVCVCACVSSGIMNHGWLRCLGTQTRLKTKFGSGYQLQFHCVKGRSHEVEEFIQAQLPQAVHMETYAGM